MCAPRQAERNGSFGALPQAHLCDADVADDARNRRGRPGAAHPVRGGQTAGAPTVRSRRDRLWTLGLYDADRGAAGFRTRPVPREETGARRKTSHRTSRRRSSARTDSLPPAQGAARSLPASGSRREILPIAESIKRGDGQVAVRRRSNADYRLTPACRRRTLVVLPLTLRTRTVVRNQVVIKEPCRGVSDGDARNRRSPTVRSANLATMSPVYWLPIFPAVHLCRARSWNRCLDAIS